MLWTTLLIAQTGFAKTLLGYVAAGVLIVIGLALVVRPTHRPPADKPKR
jgi:hypothetical protein